MNRLFVFSLLCLMLFPICAQARVDIIPRKIIMDTRDRSAELTVLNLFDTEGTFRVDVLSYRQNEDGTYKTLDVPLDINFDPNKVVRFSPRQFTLPSMGRQKIRVSLRKPSDLAEGEYRFHIKVLRFADLDAPSSSDEDNGMSISMKMNVGVAIPILVRHGGLSSTAQLKNVNLISDTSKTNTGKPELRMTIERNGNQSTIGFLEAIWKPDGYSETDRIGYIDNMNVFTDISQRQVSLPLKYIPQGAGSIHLRYVENGLSKTKGNVYDEVSLDQ